MNTAHDRLVELKQERSDRIYAEAVAAAGFDDDTDYDAWLVLEELRKLTLAERKAIADKENPPKYASGGMTVGSGTIIINPGAFTDFSLPKYRPFGL